MKKIYCSSSQLLEHLCRLQMSENYVQQGFTKYDKFYWPKTLDFELMISCTYFLTVLKDCVLVCNFLDDSRLFYCQYQPKKRKPKDGAKQKIALTPKPLADKIQLHLTLDLTSEKFPSTLHIVINKQTIIGNFRVFFAFLN